MLGYRLFAAFDCPVKVTDMPQTQCAMPIAAACLHSPLVQTCMQPLPSCSVYIATGILLLNDPLKTYETQQVLSADCHSHTQQRLSL